MPGLTINTQDVARQQPATSASSSNRSSSPSAPPISPITPTAEFVRGTAQQHHQQQQVPAFLRDRQTFTHSQPDQLGMPPPPPPPEPISFDDNPDVLALKSAISILQLQKARATRDLQTLSRAKEAALADTEGFIADLASGRVGTEGDRLFPDLAPGRLATGDAVDEEGRYEDEDDSSDEEMQDTHRTPADSTGAASSSITPPQDNDDRTTASQNREGTKRRAEERSTPAPPWRTLPKVQSVVRCPPVNWAQYGVVGESLDKLHAEQQRAPSQGVPATLKPRPGGGGALTYEFKGESSSSDNGSGSNGGEPKRLVGVAAPFTPGRDKLEKKAKGGAKRS